jgi:hypothetical protein
MADQAAERPVACESCSTSTSPADDMSSWGMMTLNRKKPDPQVGIEDNESRRTENV